MLPFNVLQLKFSEILFICGLASIRTRRIAWSERNKFLPWCLAPVSVLPEAEKPAKSPGAENPPKKTCRKFAKKKNTKQERGPRWPIWGPCDMDTNGAGVVFNRKIRFATFI